MDIMNKLLLKLLLLFSLTFITMQSWALPTCPPTGYFDNCYGTYIHENGDKYVGEWKNDEYHGQGTFYFLAENKNKGDKYVGEWKDSNRNGQGTYTWSDGEKYLGEFKDGNSDGFGIHYNADGSIHKQGIWKDDKFKYSENRNLNQNKSVDKKVTNKICPKDTNVVWDNCFGNYSFPKGDKNYGDRYEGMFKNDYYHGQGTFIWADGDKYVGEFKDGNQEGLGTFYSGSDNEFKGDKYVGGFKDDKRHGQGTYYYLADNESKGDKYIGEYKDGNRNGLGTYYFSDGRVEAGEFKNGMLNGYARVTNLDGAVKEGIWKDDEFQYAENKNSNEVKPSANIDNDKVLNAASGSGFAVSSKGHVVTNHHVIDGCQSIKIHFKGKVIPTTIINFDPGNDVALLKGDFTPSHILPLSNEKTELLQDVFVAGYPFGNKISTSIKVTKGIISSLTGIGNNFSNFQIDAALQPGNSGGPILNNKGNVIGVAVAKLDRKYIEKNFGVLPENTNFGIKTSVVKSMLNSSDISLPNPNKNEISKSELGKNISNATYYLSCWMTMAQIEKAKSNKVVFKNLEN